MLIAMVDMLVGVFLRYVMTWVSATFDLPSIRFFWVEEIGEYSLAWLTFIGAALGIRRGVHFSVQMLTERWPLGARRALVAVHYALLAGFISLVAVLAITNVGTGVNAVYTNIDSQVKTIPAGTGS